jgi:hypothetical protein
MRSGYFGGSQLEEVDSMMGLPIRDARADGYRAQAAGDAGIGHEPTGVKQGNEVPEGEPDEDPANP